jgi:hypothetical protein
LLLLAKASNARAGRSGGGAKARWSGLRRSDVGAMHGDALGSDLTRTERGREGGGRMGASGHPWGFVATSCLRTEHGDDT